MGISLVTELEFQKSHWVVLRVGGQGGMRISVRIRDVRSHLMRKSCEVETTSMIKKNTSGLPCWHSGQESACQCRRHGFQPWCRRHGFQPWSGKIPHAAEQLSPCTTTTEPALQSLRATTTELTCHNYAPRAHMPRACAPQHEKPPR